MKTVTFLERNNVPSLANSGASIYGHCLVLLRYILLLTKVFSCLLRRKTNSWEKYLSTKKVWPWIHIAKLPTMALPSSPGIPPKRAKKQK